MSKIETTHKVWETFLLISPGTTDEAPAADPAYLIAKGMEPEAPQVLRLLRQHVIPAIELLKTEKLNWYSFLVHNRDSGVPTTEDDKNCYIHLRVRFEDKIDLRLPLPFCMTRPIELGREVAGVDRKLLAAQPFDPIDLVWDLIGEQSQFLVRVVGLHRDGIDDFELLKQIRQFLHYFSNMTQMRIA